MKLGKLHRHQLQLSRLKKLLNAALKAWEFRRHLR